MPWNTSGTFAVRLSVETLTANREILWPDSDGTVAIGAGIGSGVSVLTLHRTDMMVEGGQVSFNRAADDGLAWAIDVFGSGSVATVLRFIDGKAGTVPMFIDQSSGDVVVNKLRVLVDASIANNLQVAGTLSVSAGATIGGNLTVSGATVAIGTVAIKGALSVSGVATLSGSLDVSATATASTFFSARTAVAGVVSGVMTNIYKFPTIAEVGTHIVTVSLGYVADVTNYGAFAIVYTDGATGKLMFNQGAALMSISLSSLQVMANQNSGANQTVKLTVTTLSRTL